MALAKLQQLDPSGNRSPINNANFKIPQWTERDPGLRSWEENRAFVVVVRLSVSLFDCLGLWSSSTSGVIHQDDRARHIHTDRQTDRETGTLTNSLVLFGDYSPVPTTPRTPPAAAAATRRMALNINAPAALFSANSGDNSLFLS